MKKPKKRGLIEYGLLGWFLAFCLMIGLAITSEIKAKPVYFSNVVTGIEIEDSYAIEQT